MIGFDIKPGDSTLKSQALRMAREVGAELGKRVVEVETNLRDWSEPCVHWSWYHGSALAAVAHLLSREFEKFYISSTYAEGQLHPWGTHPELDPLWGNDSIQLIHDGCEARRTDKISFIAKSPVALKYLRVCYENRNGAYNCGRCEKCLRTMVTLEALGLLDRCAAFPPRINRWHLKRLIVTSEDAKIFIRENVDLIGQMPASPARRRLRADLDDLLEGRYSKGMWAVLRKLWWHLRYGAALSPIRGLVTRRP